MATLPYNEFEWNVDGAGGGESGVGLADLFIKQVAALDKVERVCDLACGNGYISGRLAALGYDVVGVDASESGIQLATKNHPRVQFINAVIGGTYRRLSPSTLSIS